MAAGDLVGDRYRLLDRLDDGGMGEVWRAADQRLGDKTVAVKQLRPRGGVGASDLDIDLFRREAHSASRLGHPNVVAVTDFFVEDRAPYIVMEYVRGLPASAWARQPERTDDQLLALAREIAAALATVHAAGLVHRDVKPENIVVRDSGSAVLVDFGITREVGEASLTGTGFVRGTLRYLAPEILEGAHASAASDMWSFGATLFELTEGHPAFDGPTHTSIITAILAQPIPAPTSDAPLAAIVSALLRRNSGARPAAAELIRLAAEQGAPAGNKRTVARSTTASAPAARPNPKPAPTEVAATPPVSFSAPAAAPLPTEIVTVAPSSDPVAPAARALRDRKSRGGPIQVLLWVITMLGCLGLGIAAFLPWWEADGIKYSVVDDSATRAPFSEALASGTRSIGELGAAVVLYLCVLAAIITGLRALSGRSSARKAPLVLGILVAAAALAVILWLRHSTLKDPYLSGAYIDITSTLRTGGWMAIASAAVTALSLGALGLRRADGLKNERRPAPD